MNYIPEIAKMLGVEIGEEFKIEGLLGDTRYKLTRENLEYFYDGRWYTISGTLNYLLNGEYKLVKLSKPILDEVEKEYLFRFIRPFKERINYIVKLDVKDIDDEREYILIIYKEPYNTSIPRLMELPSFKKGAMYKGMKLGERYTLKELGLWNINQYPKVSA